MQSIINRRLTQAQAAQQLKLSIRQVKRLTRAYRSCGATGLAYMQLTAFSTKLSYALIS